jgi:hypothetical protein
MEHEHQADIEKIRAQLQIANVQFAHTYKKQAEIIESIYKKTLFLAHATDEYIGVLQNTGASDTLKIEKGVIMDESKNELYIFLEENKLYLPSETARTAYNYLQKLIGYRQINVKFEIRARHQSANIEKLENELFNVTMELRELKDALIKDFQTLLGVIQNKTMPA